MLFLQLWHSSRFVRSISSLETPLRMSVDFVGGVVGRKGKSVEGVVDAGGVESRVAFGCRGFGVELGEV